MANKMVSEFLTALADDPAMQAAWQADPEQCALDFGLSPGLAKTLADAKTTDAVRQILKREGAEAKMALWIK